MHENWLISSVSQISPQQGHHCGRLGGSAPLRRWSGIGQCRTFLPFARMAEMSDIDQHINASMAHWDPGSEIYLIFDQPSCCRRILAFFEVNKHRKNVISWWNHKEHGMNMKLAETTVLPVGWCVQYICDDGGHTKLATSLSEIISALIPQQFSSKFTMYLWQNSERFIHSSRYDSTRVIWYVVEVELSRKLSCRLSLPVNFNICSKCCMVIVDWLSALFFIKNIIWIFSMSIFTQNSTHKFTKRQVHSRKKSISQLTHTRTDLKHRFLTTNIVWN